MTVEQFLAEHGVKIGATACIVLTLIQIAPVKINPWTWLGKMIKAIFSGLGKRLMSAVLAELENIKTEQKNMKDKLEEHITTDDYRAADAKRRAILHFNNEVCRGQKHTKEGWVDILADIDSYEIFCKNNEKYPNTRAECAIENLKLSYKDALRDGDFLPEGRISKEMRAQ